MGDMNGMRFERAPIRLARGVCLIAVAFAVPLLGACRERLPESQLPEPTEISVTELGGVGGRIYNEPHRTRQILAEAGLTPEEFEERVLRVSNDPELAREYARAFEATARSTRPIRPVTPDTAVLGDTGTDAAGARDTGAAAQPQS